MKTLSEIFDKQLSEELQSIQKLLRNNIGSEDNLSDTISYFPDGSQFPSYHDQRCEHTYSTIIQKEIANRRNIVSLLRQYLCSMWGDSESERYYSF